MRAASPTPGQPQRPLLLPWPLPLTTRRSDRAATFSMVMPPYPASSSSRSVAVRTASRASALRTRPPA